MTSLVIEVSRQNILKQILCILKRGRVDFYFFEFVKGLGCFCKPLLWTGACSLCSLYLGEFTDWGYSVLPPTALLAGGVASH